MSLSMRLAKHVFAIMATVIGVASVAVAQPEFPTADLQVTAERVSAADSDKEVGNWLAHGRTYGEQRFSPLNQVTETNVGELGLAWAFPTGVGRGHEATPLVVDGVMYFTLPWSIVVALNAQTGQLLWTYDPKVPTEWGRNACCDVVNRGVALWKGMVFGATLDGRLVALDAKSGALLWEVMTIDKMKPYTITGAPRIVKDKVVIGNGGSEYGVRGYITAYDALSGKQAWRFYTVPGNPAEPFEHPELEAAAKTWTGEWWNHGGGGTAWDSMAYDAELDTLYVGTGNGSPWNRAIRSPQGGDNLYISSILALNPETGRLKWHYQTTPADCWDYTATQHIILADLDIEGKARKVLLQAPKNGFFYVLDRESGQLISAKNYTNVTWAKQVDMTTGRPVETGTADYATGPRMVFPSPTGGHNWQPMTFDPQTKLVYIPALVEPFLFMPEKEFKRRNMAWNTGVDFPGAVAAILGSGMPPKVIGSLKAWDPVGQKVVWEVKHDTQMNGGVLSTAGNLVFQGTGSGRFAAYRATDGEKLWEKPVDIGMIAPPITYRVGDEQYVAILAGWGGVPAIVGSDAGLSAASTHANKGHLLAFKLGGKAEMPVIEEKRLTQIPEPPASDATEEVVKRGDVLYHQNCFQCHGLMAVSSGVTSDLRFMSSAVHKNFRKILLESGLVKKGMASYEDLLSEQDVEAIHAYLVVRAGQDRARQAQAAAATP